MSSTTAPAVDETATIVTVVIILVLIVALGAYFLYAYNKPDLLQKGIEKHFVTNVKRSGLPR